MLLSDPLAVTGIFLIGASAGASLTYARCKQVLRDCRRALAVTSDHEYVSETSDPRFHMKALIVGRDSEMIGIFSYLFREKHIEAQKCSDESSALEQLASEKFAAIVLDFDDVRGCADILRRMAGPNKQVPVFAVGTDSQLKEAASDLGAATLIARPLVLSEVRELLSAAYGRMLRYEQTYFRISVELPVSIRKGSGELLHCTTLNVSQTGMAVRTPSSFTVGETLTIAFAIPNTDVFVSAEGSVIWDDKHGKAGMTLQCSSASMEARFNEWLHDHFFMTISKSATQDAKGVKKAANA